MNVLDLYATGTVARASVRASGEAAFTTSGHADRVHLGGFHHELIAVEALLMANAQSRCFHDGRGWWEAPADLAHELWRAARPGGWPATVVARITPSTGTLTLTSELAAHLGDLTETLAAFQRHYALIHGAPPIRTPRHTSVITGGPIPAVQGA